jgi:hypothetical protein
VPLAVADVSQLTLTARVAGNHVERWPERRRRSGHQPLPDLAALAEHEDGHRRLRPERLFTFDGNDDLAGGHAYVDVSRQCRGSSDRPAARDVKADLARVLRFDCSTCASRRSAVASRCPDERVPPRIALRRQVPRNVSSTRLRREQE